MSETIRQLKDVAVVIRSKNAGPYELTLDVIFENVNIYKSVKATHLFNREMIAGLYGIPEEDVLGVIHYDPAHAIKVTLRRAVPSGGIGDRDVYGAQQHAPLLAVAIAVPESNAIP